MGSLCGKNALIAVTATDLPAVEALVAVEIWTHDEALRVYAVWARAREQHNRANRERYHILGSRCAETPLESAYGALSVTGTPFFDMLFQLPYLHHRMLQGKTCNAIEPEYADAQFYKTYRADFTLDFVAFALAMWLATTTELDVVAYDMLDSGNTGVITRDKLDRLVRSLHVEKGAIDGVMAGLRADEQGRVTRAQFTTHCVKFDSLLFPAFQLRNSIRETLYAQGTHDWAEAHARAKRIVAAGGAPNVAGVKPKGGAAAAAVPAEGTLRAFLSAVDARLPGERGGYNLPKPPTDGSWTPDDEARLRDFDWKVTQKEGLGMVNY